MWVKMLLYISGGRPSGQNWPQAGVPFEVEDWEGQSLLHQGVAVRCEAPAPPPEPEPEKPGEPSDELDSAGYPAADADEVTGETGPPASGEPKSAWVAYAVSQGVPQSEAESLTKLQLQSAYGGRLLS